MLRKRICILFIFSILCYSSGLVLSICLPHEMNQIGESQGNCLLDLSFANLLKNNLASNLSICFFGLGSFGIYALFALFLNGYVLGLNLKWAVHWFEDPSRLIVRSVLPHSFELLSLWLAGSIGLYGGILCVRLFKGKSILDCSELVWFGRFLCIIFMLTILAALVESKVSLPWTLGEWK